MSERLKLWAFSLFMTFVVILMSVNGMIAAFVVSGMTKYGMTHEFDRIVIGLLGFFGFLLMAEFLNFFLFSREKIFESVLANVWMIFVRSLWLLPAGVLTWAFFMGIVDEFYWIFVGVIMAICLANLPWLVFHTILCFPAYRTIYKQMNESLDQDRQARTTEPQQASV